LHLEAMAKRPFTLSLPKRLASSEFVRSQYHNFVVRGSKVPCGPVPLEVQVGDELHALIFNGRWLESVLNGTIWCDERCNVG